MSGIYGNPLYSFPEQTRDFKYFWMDPKINDGYEARTNEQVLSGILQNNESGAKDSNGNIVRYKALKLWVSQRLNDGWFVEFSLQNADDYFLFGDAEEYPVESKNGFSQGKFASQSPDIGVIYRLVTDNDWPSEAGFFEYGLEKLVGSNGTVQKDPGFKTEGFAIG